MSEIKQVLITLVNTIPYGHVSSYGVLARIISDTLQRNVPAKVVGFLLSGMPRHERSSCCRRRVISKAGYISSLKLGEKGIIQIELLEKEGIVIKDGWIDMSKYEHIFVT